jgi:transcriptional regulator NrdR family protein
VKCPYCHAASADRVVDSRTNRAGTAVYRRRACGRCQFRFTTYETCRDLALDLNVFASQKSRAKRIAAELREMARTLEVW